jgi:hypothetical protein
MKKSLNNPIKVSIKYSDDSQIWNNFIDYLISFMVDNNFLGDINENDSSTEN